VGARCPRPTGASIVDKIGRGERDTGRVSARGPRPGMQNPHEPRDLRKSVPRVSTASPWPLPARYTVAGFFDFHRIM
jgi:hypothetical protein